MSKILENIKEAVKRGSLIDPEVFEILREESHPNALVLLIAYPTAEELISKILVYYTTESSAYLINRFNGSLDPSLVGTHNAPIAEFQPNDIGWQLAGSFARTLSNE